MAINLKIIFLDVDGVLNNDATTTRTKSGAEFVDDYLIERLKRLINETDATVVLSSSWRYGRNCNSHGDDFVELIEKLESYGIYVEDYTPELHTDDKALEINEYLGEHPDVEKFVILDDDPMSMYVDHHVRTLNRYGLTEENVDEAIEILNKNN